MAPTLVILGLLVASIRFDLTSDYGISKASLLLTVTALLMLTPFVLLPDMKSLKIFIASLTATALFVVASVLISPGSVARYTNRVTFGEADTIGTARAIGTGLVIIAVSLAVGYFRRLTLILLGTIVAASATIAMLLTGSRGPFLAAIIALVVAILFGRHGRRQRLIGIAFLTSSGLVISWWISSSGSDGATRIVDFLSGQYDASSTARSHLWSDSFDALSQSFFGVGLGNFKTLPGLESTPYVYPHNVMFEVFVECGWIAGFFLVIYLGLSLFRAARNASSHAHVVNLALLTFALMNAMVSGDINSNRLLWVVSSIAMARTVTEDASVRSRSNSPS